MVVKRDSAYFLTRLKKESPATFADYRAGKYTSVSQAAFAAGLRRPPTVLQILKREWKKARGSERQAFLAWLGSGAAPGVRARKSSDTVVDAEGRLLPAKAARIKHLMTVRKLRMGELMVKMGFPALDASLGSALRCRSRIRPTLATALEKWLSDNSSY